MLSLTSFYFQDELKKGNNNKSQLIIGENSNLSGQDQSAMTKLTTVSPHFVSMITYIKRSLNLITPVALDATNGVRRFGSVTQA